MQFFLHRNCWRLTIGTRYLVFVASLIVQALTSAYVYAENNCEHPPLLQTSVGIFNVLKIKKQAQITVEYKWSPVISTLRPLAGILLTHKGSGYVYGGLGYDIFISRYFVLTPSFAPGIYWRGKGKDLGFPLEFRSSIEAAGVFKNHMRIGLQFYHISNASFGYKNPGEESLAIFFSLPL